MHGKPTVVLGIAVIMPRKSSANKLGWQILAPRKKNIRKVVYCCVHIFLCIFTGCSQPAIKFGYNICRDGAYTYTHGQGFYIFTLQSCHTRGLVAIIISHLSAEKQRLLSYSNFQSWATEFAFCTLSSENEGSTKARNNFVKWFWLMTVSLFTVHCLTEQ